MSQNAAGIKSWMNRRRQLELDLRSVPRWGGRRPGAGRKRVVNPRIPHARRLLIREHPCHVTLRIRRGLPSLRSIHLVRALERSFREIRERRRGFRLVHYSLQHDHAHLIVEAADARELAGGMKAIGARLARAVNRVYARRGAVLADRFHVHVLRTPTEVRHAIAYVPLNARRHLGKTGRRIDPRARIDPASSGRWFDGGCIPLPVACDESAVAPPRTWLLQKGWRREGRIHPSNIPGERKAGGRVTRSPVELEGSPLISQPAQRVSGTSLELLLRLQRNLTNQKKDGVENRQDLGREETAV